MVQAHTPSLNNNKKKKKAHACTCFLLFLSRADDALFIPFFIIIKKETCRILGCYLESSHYYSDQNIGLSFFIFLKL